MIMFCKERYKYLRICQLGIQLFEKSQIGNKQINVKAFIMVHSQVIFSLIFIFLAAEYRGESQSAEISRSPMKMVNEDEYIGKKSLFSFFSIKKN